jgi:acetyl esterase/lipase
MTKLELWPGELDALRSEARAAVAGAIGLFPTGRRDGVARLSRLERVRVLRETMAAMYAPVPDAEERTIEGVRCRVFLPDGPARAVYLHFHGGGMMLGAPEMMDVPNRDLARGLGVAVVSADYRKAPEHPWPAGPDDGLAVAAYLLEHGERDFGSARLLVGGESAGGYMSAAVALRVRDELGAIDRVAGLNLVFGVYDWGRAPSQRGVRPHDGPDVLDPDGIEFFADCYLPGRTPDERRDPAISPACADLRGLPPCLVSVGTCDHLLDDSLVLATRAAAAGVDVDLFVAPDMPHGFMFFECEMTRRWRAHTDAWLRARIA